MAVATKDSVDDGTVLESDIVLLYVKIAHSLCLSSLLKLKTFSCYAAIAVISTGVGRDRFLTTPEHAYVIDMPSARLELKGTWNLESDSK